MPHIDENINGKYCEICKKNIAMRMKLFDTTYICESCVSKISTSLTPLDVIQEERKKSKCD